MRSDEHLAPVVEIRMPDATGKLRPLPVDVVLHELEVGVSSEVGLASETTVQFLMWDGIEVGYVVANENILWNGTRFEVWSGYGVPDRCHGLFTVQWRNPSYPQDSPPSLTIHADDGLTRLMHHMQGFVFEKQVSEIPALQDLAERAGLELDADPVLSGPDVPRGDRAKKVGSSDIEYCKTVAQAYGLGMPRVEYRPQADGSGFGTEVLVLRKLTVASVMGSAAAPRFTAPHGKYLRYIGPDETGGELAHFETDFNTADIPIAVEVLGFDRGTGKIMRATVKATPRGPEVESFVAVDKGELSQLPASQRKPVQEGDQFAIYLLGEGGETIETGLTYKARGKTIQAKRYAHETLHAATATASAGVLAFAEQWMQARMDGFWSGFGAIENIQGAHELDIDQVHRVDGLLPSDNGYWILTRVDHSWSAQGHAVDFNCQKLIVGGA